MAWAIIVQCQGFFVGLLVGSNIVERKENFSLPGSRALVGSVVEAMKEIWVLFLDTYITIATKTLNVWT